MDDEAAKQAVSSFLFGNVVEKWVESALDYGIDEKDFWEMTLAELVRAIESKKRMRLLEAKEKAIGDYQLADLIGKSIARLYSSSNKMPHIAEVYPTLFDSEEQQEAQQQKKDELSALRFKQFANAFNSRFKKEVAKN